VDPFNLLDRSRQRPAPLTPEPVAALLIRLKRASAQPWHLLLQPHGRLCRLLRESETILILRESPLVAFVLELTHDRWTYLEKNIDNVMWNLQEGLDMKTYMYAEAG
jgi:hypothetical protein